MGVSIRKYSLLTLSQAVKELTCAYYFLSEITNIMWDLHLWMGSEPIYKNVSDTLDMYCITQIHNNHTWHVQWQVLLKTLAPSVAA